MKMPSKRRPRSKRRETTQPDRPEPTYRTTSYVVYPAGYDAVDHPGKERWCLAVVDAGNGWAIRRGDMCLNIALQWEHEREPELSDSQFVLRCRYNEHAALLRARRVVDNLEVGGLTFSEIRTAASTQTESVRTDPASGFDASSDRSRDA